MNKITAVLEGINLILKNDEIVKFLCGTYTDGSVRSLSDCLSGEIISPSDKLKAAKKKKKKNKKVKYKDIKKYYK